MGRTLEKNLPFRHDPAFRGVFVQRSTRGWCVTFPRLSNLHQEGGYDDDAIFPSRDFKTFSLAFNFASHVREIDSRIRQCKIFLCNQKMIGSVGHRVTQQIA